MLTRVSVGDISLLCADNRLESSVGSEGRSCEPLYFCACLKLMNKHANNIRLALQPLAVGYLDANVSREDEETQNRSERGERLNL